MVKTASFSSFQSLDIRVGTIVKCDEFKEARKPAFKLWVDFGKDIGILQSSAQITALYQASDLEGKQVLAVVNFEQKQVANFMSQCLVLGVYTQEGVVLLAPDRPCENGDKLG